MKKNDPRLILVQSASKVVLGLFVLITATSIFKEVNSGHQAEKKRQSADKEERERMAIQLKLATEQHQLADLQNEKEKRDAATKRRLAAQQQHEVDTRRLLENENFTVKCLNQYADSHLEVSESLHKVLYYFFDAATYKVGTQLVGRVDFCAESVNFYGAVLPIKEVGERFRAQESQFPSRKLTLVKTFAKEVENDVFNIRAEVDTRLVDRFGSPSSSVDTYFLRAQKIAGYYKLTAISNAVFPGWVLAEYKARISPEDLKRSGPQGVQFSSLKWQNQAEQVREIVLQDRYNYEQRITNDSGDEPEAYFVPDRTGTVKGMIAKRRDEWVSSQMPIILIGDINRLTSGAALVQVMVLKEEKILVRVLQ